MGETDFSGLRIFHNTMLLLVFLDHHIYSILSDDIFPTSMGPQGTNFYDSPHSPNI